MSEPQSVTVISDAGPIIHLDELGCSDLLVDLGTILIPTAVAREITHHRPNALATPPFPFAIVNATDEPALRLAEIAKRVPLHAGELAAIRLALARCPAMLLTDDTAARLAARSLGLSARGTLGIVVRAIRKRIRSREQVVEILTQLPSRSTLHLKPSLLAEVIRDVETHTDKKKGGG